MPDTDRPNPAAHGELYEAGIVLRRKVMLRGWVWPVVNQGDEYVDNQLKKGTSEFMRPMQEVCISLLAPIASEFELGEQLATEAAWGTIWTRPGLELKQRSLINVALLASQGKSAELGAHIRGAVNNGASVVEIRETLLQTAVYCGIPTGMESFRVADAVLATLKEEGKI
ncbi:hypothetical protein D9615_002647 [Tricholomella constricta]|uniref:Carboxymuconolactone decarboxylase-like domain-containing protein n=1 Tax=Tricholomella constricta TaxID=117010 RepID=A0A8H5M9Z3_9AGAR|nr:hypothetical protein D9615_002647 [Tricholomella constricta]